MRASLLSFLFVQPIQRFQNIPNPGKGKNIELLMAGAASSFRKTAQGLFFSVVFVKEGNVLCAVLPYCFLNCILFGLVTWGEQSGIFYVSFSPNGHGLMTLLVSFLVISKVNLAYDRFKEARRSVGDAFLRLRELCQLVANMAEAAKVTAGEDDQPELERIEAWKSTSVEKVMELLDATSTVIQSKKLARQLAFNKLDNDGVNTKVLSEDYDDPIAIVQILRLHLYMVNDSLQLLERVQLITKLAEFLTDYRLCLQLASTPLPFCLVQMGRVFLCIWTFTMPLVLRQGPFSDVWSAMVFLFFLTYGFIGLELAAMALASPFGDGPNDIGVTALRDAVYDGIERDLVITQTSSAGKCNSWAKATNPRLRFSNQKNADSSNSATNAAIDEQIEQVVSSSSYYHLP